MALFNRVFTRALPALAFTRPVANGARSAPLIALAAAATTGALTWQVVAAQEQIDGSPAEYPWKYSVKGSDTATLRKVVAAGGDVNAYDKHNKAAIHWAAERGDVNMLRALVNELGFKPINAVTGEGENAMHKAAGRGQLAAMRTLVTELGLDEKGVNAQDNNGSTALHKASRRGHIKAVKALVNDLGFTNIDARDKNGETALHQTVVSQTKSHLKVMKVLVQTARCSVNVADNNGETALHKAASKGLIPAMRTLVLDLGFIDVQAKNALGETALDKAKEGKHYEAVKVLIEELLPAAK
eukprot:TRINITY_DN14615_c0_g1_i2.p1 TRINITY_DN14615_c0_g1~~TRINITY_DN14615_c0_g1_i2.p1  ORF type:complete len:299 (+),score=75.13 TRINITY_DN14615_c0_g1_i2:621-1517(+)